MALVIYALFLALFLKVPNAKQGDISFYADGQTRSIEGIIKSFPSQKEDRTTFILKVLSADGKPARGQLYIDCKSACAGLERGQNITFNGDIYQNYANTNFGSFNWAQYLARQKVFATAKVREITGIKTASRLWVFISGARNSMLNVFRSNFPPNIAPVLAGITIGEKADIDAQLNAAFQDSGAMHLLVASGSNVGFVTLVVYFICALFGFGRISSASLALILALFYTLIAGGDSPLVRAYIMTLSSTAGFILGRKSGVIQGLIIAAFAILIFNPQSIFDAGFQMSFLAALSIILLAANFTLSSKIPPSAAFVLRIFFVSFAAQAALLPVFANYFYKVSLSAVLSNIILVPLSGVIMAGGFIVWLLSFIPWHSVFGAGVFILKEILIFFTFTVQFFAGFAWSKIITSALSGWTISAYYILLFGLLNMPIVKKKKLFTAVICALAALVFTTGIFVAKDKIYILSGRYNYSVLIKDRSGIKVFGGGSDAKTLSRAVLASGSTKIDCLFLNGITKSSVYALKDLENIKIKNIYLPHGDIAQDAAALILQSGAQTKMLWAGDSECGVLAKEPWYQNDDGSVYFGHGDNLSYEYKDLQLSGNLKQVKQSGNIIEFKKEDL